MIETSSHDFLISVSQYGLHLSPLANVIIKLDSTGQLLWKKSLSMPCGANAIFLIELNDSTFIRAGAGEYFCQSNYLSFASYSKLDSSGTVLWTKFLGGTDFTYTIHDIVPDVDGGFMCLGIKDSSLRSTTILIKFDNNGNELYRREFIFPTGSYQNYLKIIQHSDSSYYMSAINVLPYLYHIGYNGDSLQAWNLVDTAVTGQYDLIRDVKFLDGKYLCLIQKLNNFNFIKMYFTELDLQLSTLIHYNIPGSSASAFIPWSNGEKILLGICNNTTGGYNNLLVKLDSSNTIAWSYCLHPEFLLQSNTFQMHKTSDNSVILTASIDSSGQGGYESIYFLKTDTSASLFTSLFTPEENNEVTVYPNPVNDKLTIDAQGIPFKRILLYDLYGKKITEYSPGVNEVDLSHLPAGMYFLHFFTGQKRWVKKVVKR